MAELDPFESFIGTWGGTVTFTWEPDPHIVAAEIMRVAEALEDMTKPLLASQAVARADMQVRFDTDTDPDGAAWMPLDEDYARKKQSMGYDPSDILTATGAGESAATSPAAFPIMGDTLFYDTGSLPDYMLYHQHGSGEGNVGQAADYRQRVAAGAYGKGETSHVSQGIGRGNALPKRPFIGISEKAQIQIIEIFDLWFDEASSISIGKGGIVQERGPGGRFGKRLFPNL